MSLQDIQDNYDDDDATLTQLIAKGRAYNTVLSYTNHLQRLYAKVHEVHGEAGTLPYDDYNWLADRASVEAALDLIKPETVVKHTVTAVRGVLKALPHLYSLYDQHSQDHIPKTMQTPTQGYTKKEEEKWVSLADLKRHLKTYEPALNALHQRRRAARGQAGFPAQPFALTVEEKKEVCKHLALSLYTNQPPVRLDMADLIIYHRAVPEHHADNYLFCKDPDQKPHPTYIATWTKFKTSKFKPEGVSTPFKPLVCKHVHESLKLWPRRYLLSLLTDSERPLGKSYLSKVLSAAGPKPGLGCGMFRKIFISHAMRNEKSESERKQLADAMHHTVPTQRNTYERKGTIA